MIRPRLHFSSVLSGGVLFTVIVLANLIPRDKGCIRGHGWPAMMLASATRPMIPIADDEELKRGWKVPLDFRMFPNAVFTNFFSAIIGTTLMIVLVEYANRKRDGQLPPPASRKE